MYVRAGISTGARHWCIQLIKKRRKIKVKITQNPIFRNTRYVSIHSFKDRKKGCQFIRGYHHNPWNIWRRQVHQFDPRNKTICSSNITEEIAKQICKERVGWIPPKAGRRGSKFTHPSTPELCITTTKCAPTCHPLFHALVRHEIQIMHQHKNTVIKVTLPNSSLLTTPRSFCF